MGKEGLPDTFFYLSEEELKVVKAMGLPVNMKDWTPEIIKSVYDKWEEEKQKGVDSFQQIRQDALNAGVDFDVAHQIHDAVASVHILQQRKKP